MRQDLRQIVPIFGFMTQSCGIITSLCALGFQCEAKTK
jgi:hypothetical protein